MPLIKPTLDLFLNPGFSFVFTYKSSVVDLPMHEKPIPNKSTHPNPASEGVSPIIQALVHLHIARRNLLIYPVSHEQVKRSIIKAFQSFAKLVVSKSSITFAVLKEGISIGDRILESKNSALLDLAGVMKQYEIATVTFVKGFDIKELARFLQLLSMDRDKVMSKGGIAAVAQSINLSSILIQAVDYSKLRLTAEQEIHRSSETESRHGSVWQQFVSNLMTTQPDQIYGSDAQIDPGQLADMLNKHTLNIDQVVDFYLKSISGADMSEAGLSTMTEDLLSFQQMIKDLDPQLKKQFLSATFDNCGQVATASDTAHLIDGLGGDLIVEMLHQASSEGKKISPSLLSFIKKMNLSTTVKISPTSTGQGGRKEDGYSSQSVASLLAPERYDTFVESEYEKFLDSLTSGKLPEGRSSSMRLVRQEVGEQLTETNLKIHVGRAIVRLMIHSEDIAEYRDWGRQLTYMLDELLEGRAYRYLTRLIHLTRRETKKSDKQRTEIAGLVLKRFSDPEFVAKAIDSIPSSQGEVDPNALAFLIELGEPVVVEIFDGLDPNLRLHEQAALVHILESLSSFAAKEALERLKDSRPEYVRQMLRIICKMGDGESAQQVRSLTDHHDLNVRLEALATLLKFGNKWGVVRLRDMLSEVTGDALIEAVELAGSYRVGAVVPQLEAVIEQGGERELREAAIRALGSIGDPRSLTTLEKLVRRRWSIVKKRDRYLKQVVFETLGGYPREAVQALLHYGLKQKDDAIQLVCKRLLRKGGEVDTHDS